MPEPGTPAMSTDPASPVPASPLSGIALPEVDGVACIKTVSPSVRLALRTDLDTARRIGVDLGVPLDTAINRAALGDAAAALRLGPDEWLLMAAPGLESDLPARIGAAAGAPFSLVDVGHRTLGLVIAGAEVEAVLAAGCPLPLAATEFAVGKATRTILAKAEIILWRQSAHAFRIEVARSFAAYVVELLATAIAGEAAILRQERRR